VSIARIVAELVKRGEEELAEELLAFPLAGPQSELVYRKVLDMTKKKLSKFEDEVLGDIIKQFPTLSRKAAISLKSELDVWHRKAQNKLVDSLFEAISPELPLPAKR
jgi:hypothetical protein